MSLKGWKYCDGHFLLSSKFCLFSVDKLIVSFSDLQAALEALRSEITEKEKSTEKEIEALRKAGRDRERDLDTLNTVLQCNQDIISVRSHTACLAVPLFLFDTRLEMQDNSGNIKQSCQLLSCCLFCRHAHSYIAHILICLSGCFI